MKTKKNKNATCTVEGFETHLEYMRHKKGISIEELAKKSGVIAEDIYFFEEQFGTINIAPVIVIYNLSKVLDCSIDELLDLEKQD